MIARCHAQIFVDVVIYIGAYHLLSLSTYSKRMRLLTRFYGNISQNTAGQFDLPPESALTV